jgi:hypothetical protein
LLILTKASFGDWSGLPETASIPNNNLKQHFVSESPEISPREHELFTPIAESAVPFSQGVPPVSICGSSSPTTGKVIAKNDAKNNGAKGGNNRSNN